VNRYFKEIIIPYKSAYLIFFCFRPENMVLNREVQSSESATQGTEHVGWCWHSNCYL